MTNSGKTIPYRKKTIPKTLKNDVWDYYIGRKYGIGNCFCCRNKIDSKNFHCGHVIAESKGGKTHINNLRPLCNVCNLSMRNENMYIFMKKYGYKKSCNYYGIYGILLFILFITIISFIVYYYQIKILTYINAKIYPYINTEIYLLCYLKSILKKT